ncbi:MAG: hypothetical protein K8L97_03635 [Anaerolineae bacterium]|nr:hypothetical protein [Anaerolineae bacterium]
MTIPPTRRHTLSPPLTTTALLMPTADNDICDMPASLVPADNDNGYVSPSESASGQRKSHIFGILPTCYQDQMSR